MSLTTTNPHEYYSDKFNLERAIEDLVNQFEKAHPMWEIKEICFRRTGPVIQPSGKPSVKIKTTSLV